MFLYIFIYIANSERIGKSKNILRKNSVSEFWGPQTILKTELVHQPDVGPLGLFPPSLSPPHPQGRKAAGL